MANIYEPKGAAREYSPLALNHYKGCDHGCIYCYVPKIKRVFDPGYDHKKVEEVWSWEGFLKSAKKHFNSPSQVLLSFMTDPYCDYNNEVKVTREVLKILLENQIPVAILTKGGNNVLQDLDIIKKFGSNIKIGMSLTTTNEKESRKWEPYASTPLERLETLKILKANNINTWASMEPVYDPAESLRIMREWSPWIDHFKIGKMNHMARLERTIDWNLFFYRAVKIMRDNDKLFYIKKDLRQQLTPRLNEYFTLKPHETDMDYLCVKNTF